MKRQKNNQQTGFTLVELLVVLGIFSLVMASLLQFLTNFLNLKFNSEARQRMRNEATYVLDRIDYLIRNGLTIPDLCRTTAGAGEVTLGQVANSANTVTSVPVGKQGIIVKIKENDGTEVRKKVYLNNEGVIILVDDVTLVNGAATGYTKEIALTASEVETAKAPIIVENLTFECREDSFTNGLVVETNFDMTVQRQSMQAGDQSDLNEHFTKVTAVRNRFDY